MEELKRVHELRVDEFSRRRMIESQREYRNCKMNSSVWMLQGIFKIWIYTQWTIIPRSQSTCVTPRSSWKFGRNAELRAQLAIWHMESASFFGKRSCLSTCDCLNTLWRNAQLSTGKPVAEGREESQDTILCLRFLRRPSAQNSFNPMDGRYLKNCGADQQRLQTSELHLDNFPTPTTFSCWKMRFKTETCTCWNFSTEGMLWSKKWRWLIQRMI